MGGSAVVPFSPDFSFLMYSVNDDSSLGPVLPPLMPYNETPLSSQEYYTLWNWINDGCPNGTVNFDFLPMPTGKILPPCCPTVLIG